MKRKIRALVEKIFKPILIKLKHDLEISLKNESVAQKSLMQQYRLLAEQNLIRKLSFNDIGFRKYSQFDEDGILLYIFSLINPINKVCVEICAESGIQCNTTNLIINHGWFGYLFDGDEKNVSKGKYFFSKQKDTFLYPPRFNKAWITAENVNDVLSNSGVSGPIDLLSLDIDGMDYWVWKAIDVIEPQVVVCEIHNMIPADKSITVPYDPNFICTDEDFRGVSLNAMTKLANEKGYRLIGTHKYGFNVFYLKNEVGEEYFPEVSPESCLKDPYTIKVQKEKWTNSESKGWIEV